MVFEKSLLVIQICLPVFFMIGVGFYLKQKNILKSDAQQFMNWLVYWICMPVLIFRGISKQDFSTLLDPAVIYPTILMTIALIIVYWVLASVFGIRTELKGPFCFGPVWGNVSYLGFPLANSAFGVTGLSIAGVVNAFTLPLFFVSGVFLLNLTQQKQSGERKGLLQVLWNVMKNPIIIAALLGLIVSFLSIDLSSQSAFMQKTVGIVDKILEQLGVMGLPLALLAVGASLKLHSIKADKFPLFATVLGKLFIFPLLTYLVIKNFFPDTANAVVGTAVILMASPAAVASYMVTTELSGESDFVASHLVLTTMLSCITIPLWVGFLV